jgi:ABC-type uncharacterized transport system substrate-binding protein
MRRIGVPMNLGSDDTEAQARNAAFLQGLQELGWTVGRNVRIEYRWGAGDAELFRKHASELVGLAPDVILAGGGAVVPSLLQATRTVPIVFTGTPDPVGASFVESLARPGGNATGFTIFEYGISGKWLELLKEIAPHVTRAAVIRDPAIAAGLGQWGAIQSVAPSLGVELRPLGVRDAGEIERAITAFAHSPNGGLIVTGSALALVHRELITTLAARYRLPAVYASPLFANAGGLISYGPDSINPYRLAAGSSIASSRGKSQPIFRFRRRPSTSWRSISKPTSGITKTAHRRTATSRRAKLRCRCSKLAGRIRGGCGLRSLSYCRPTLMSFPLAATQNPSLVA